MGYLSAMKLEMGLKTGQLEQQAAILGLSLARCLYMRLVLGRHNRPPIAPKEVLELEKLAANLCGHLGHFPLPEAKCKPARVGRWWLQNRPHEAQQTLAKRALKLSNKRRPLRAEGLLAWVGADQSEVQKQGAGALWHPATADGCIATGAILPILQRCAGRWLFSGRDALPQRAFLAGVDLGKASNPGFPSTHHHACWSSR